MQKYDLVIIGGGPAGMAAALSAKKAGVKKLLILERDQYLGGILNQCIHPGFGLHRFKAELTGPEYADRYIHLITAENIEYQLQSFVTKITKNKIITYLRPGKLVQIQAHAIILATGCRERTREMIMIPGTRPAGVFPAGLAQKMMNIEGWLPGERAVIIGSGDIGLIMARRLTIEGGSVAAVVELAPTTKGLVRNVVQCLEDYNIPLHFRHQITAIHGKKRVEGVTVKNLADNTTFDLACDTVLISTGLIPERELLEDLNASIDTQKLNYSTIPGIFVCGNAFNVYDLVDSVSRDSAKAGEYAAKYLETL